MSEVPYNNTFSSKRSFPTFSNIKVILNFLPKGSVYINKVDPEQLGMGGCVRVPTLRAAEHPSLTGSALCPRGSSVSEVSHPRTQTTKDPGRVVLEYSLLKTIHVRVAPHSSNSSCSRVNCTHCTRTCSVIQTQRYSPRTHKNKEHQSSDLLLHKC